MNFNFIIKIIQKTKWGLKVSIFSYCLLFYIIADAYSLNDKNYCKHKWTILSSLSTEVSLTTQEVSRHISSVGHLAFRLLDLLRILSHYLDAPSLPIISLAHSLSTSTKKRAVYPEIIDSKVALQSHPLQISTSLVVLWNRQHHWKEDTLSERRPN